MKDELFERLMSPDNHETIEMYDEEGGEYRFEKVALIDSDEGKKYCLLKPIINGVSNNEIVVFLVCTGKDGLAFLRVEQDEKTIKECLKSIETT